MDGGGERWEIGGEGRGGLGYVNVWSAAMKDRWYMRVGGRAGGDGTGKGSEGGRRANVGTRLMLGDKLQVPGSRPVSPKVAISKVLTSSESLRAHRVAA